MSSKYYAVGSSTSFTDLYSTTFDGINEEVRMPNGAFDSQTDGSIGIWFKLTSLTGATKTIFTASVSGNTDSVAFSYSTGQSKLLMAAEIGDVSQYVFTLDTTTILINTWYYLLWTKTGTTHVVYVNNVSQSFTQLITPIDASSWFADVALAGTVQYTLGSLKRFGSANFFLGNLDEPTFWNAALTSGQSTELYNSGEPNDPTTNSASASLETWLRMGDGDTHPTITDQVGSNNGTMINMAQGNFVLDTP